VSTRERVSCILYDDPHGDLSDDAVGALVGVTATAVQYHRSRLGVATAQARRRDAPGARVARCGCGRVRLAQPDRRVASCGACGALVRITVNGGER